LVHTPPQSIAPAGQRHAPTWQDLPPVQTVPHPPQLMGSDLVSTHVPAQLVSVPQLHAPPVQLSPAGQTLPQVPQFFASVLTSTHAPEQLVCPVGHVDAHAPLAQTGVAPLHALAQSPQFSGSVWVLTQVEPQSFVPFGQPQLPAAQTCPDGQALPHAPQLALSVWRLMQ
jgi:hypothetical protein